MKVLQKCFDRVISSWKWKEVFFRVVLVISSRKCNPNYIDVTYKCWYVVVVCAQISNMFHFTSLHCNRESSKDTPRTACWHTYLIASTNNRNYISIFMLISFCFVLLSSEHVERFINMFSIYLI